MDDKFQKRGFDNDLMVLKLLRNCIEEQGEIEFRLQTSYKNVKEKYYL